MEVAVDIHGISTPSLALRSIPQIGAFAVRAVWPRPRAARLTDQLLYCCRCRLHQSRDSRKVTATLYTRIHPIFTGDRSLYSSENQRQRWAPKLVSWTTWAGHICRIQIIYEWIVMRTAGFQNNEKSAILSCNLAHRCHCWCWVGAFSIWHHVISFTLPWIFHWIYVVI